ncbi:MAG TPA: MFS transporter [Patescibacteria group bacterium]|nr:MFS transporter [Patescibacteria group bacterium]
MFLSFISSFFARHLRREVKELYISVTILDFAVAMVAIFEPIYLWKIGFSLPQILLFYAGVYGLYFFILPLGAKIAQGYGFEHSILYSSPFLILYYLSLFAIPFSPWFVGVSIVAFAIQKTLYWPGYHADFAVYSEDGERGREVSNLALMASIAAIAGPLVGGLLVYFFGFVTLFMIASVAILVSNVPLFSTREEFTPKTFSYTKAYKNLADPKNRRPFFAYLGYGEELIVMVVWPIFLFTVVKSELSVGSLAGFAAFVMTIVVLYVGKLTDSRNKQSILKIGTIISLVSWVTRFFSHTPLGVFFAETITRIGRNITQVPLLTLTYDQARRETVMDRVIFFEMTLIVGKLLAMGILLLLFLVVPQEWFWNIAFALAGIMTLLYGLL